jgi:lipopolysaccharide transport system ATP-binding protein
MSNLAVRVEDLAKEYRLGNYVTGRLTESLTLGAQRATRLLSRRGGVAERRSVWALRGVSFEVYEGEVVGFVGRNGAGKSTLLKILSRITEPTRGFAELYGRVGSLLEVGSGFHPELTGEENVYLYGAILGMTRREVREKFDEIVAFAEIDEFIDTPVKRYSSGMHMRLAFAVAAHLEPEILLVDEVLAVGDAAFQRKCLGKMENVAHHGRTVFFVSHNTAAVSSLCSRAFLLERGQITATGPPREVIDSYVGMMRGLLTVPVGERTDRDGDGSVRLVRVRIEDADERGAIFTGSRLRVVVDYEADRSLRFARFLVTVNDEDYTGIFVLDSQAEGGLPETLPATGSVSCTTEPIQVTPGKCFVNVSVLRGGKMADRVEYAAPFTVEADAFYSSGTMPPREWVLTVRRHQWAITTAGPGHTPEPSRDARS